MFHAMRSTESSEERVEVRLDGTEELWLRVKVVNSVNGANRNIADKAQVTLLGVHEQADDACKPLKDVCPTRNLKWSDSTAAEVVVPSCVWRYVDLTCTVFDSTRKVSPVTRIALWPPDPEGKRNILPAPGCYKLLFAMSAVNGPTTVAEATVVVDTDVRIDEVVNLTPSQLKRRVNPPGRNRTKKS